MSVEQVAALLIFLTLAVPYVLILFSREHRAYRTFQGNGVFRNHPAPRAFWESQAYVDRYEASVGKGPPEWAYQQGIRPASE